MGKWSGGKVGSNEELDEADRELWHEAGPTERFIASIELAFQAWKLAHPDEVPPPDLVAVLAAFGAERVRYLVVGGHAVGVHARPRSTRDLDLWLDHSSANVARACRALSALERRRTSSKPCGPPR
jgi:hypothetical protein